MKKLIVTVILMSFMALNLFALEVQSNSIKLRKLILNEFQLPEKTQSNIIDSVVEDADGEDMIFITSLISSDKEAVEDLKKTTIRFCDIKGVFKDGVQMSYSLIYDTKSKYLTLKKSNIKVGTASAIISFIDETYRKNPIYSISHESESSLVIKKQNTTEVNVVALNGSKGTIAYYDFYSEFLK